MIVLPNKNQEAFKCVGNAITVQHGLLPLRLGFQAAFKQRLNLPQLIQDSWNDRSTSSNAIVFSEGDWVYFSRCDHALRRFVTPQPSSAMTGMFDATEVIVSPTIPFEVASFEEHSPPAVLVVQEMPFECFLQTIEFRACIGATEKVLIPSSLTYSSVTFFCIELPTFMQVSIPDAMVGAFIDLLQATMTACECIVLRVENTATTGLDPIVVIHSNERSDHMHSVLLLLEGTRREPLHSFLRILVEVHCSRFKTPPCLLPRSMELMCPRTSAPLKTLRLSCFTHEVKFEQAAIMDTRAFP